MNESKGTYPSITLMKIMSLVTVRRTILVLATASYFALNAFGQPQRQPGFFDSDAVGSLFDSVSIDYVAGFPFEIARSPATHFQSIDNEPLINSISFWLVVSDFNVLAVLANCLLGGVGVYAVLLLFKNSDSMRFSLQSLMITVLCFAIAVGWFTQHVRLHKRENTALAIIDRDYFEGMNVPSHVAPSQIAVKSIGGFQPLRILFPSKAWQFLDHVLAVEIDAESSDVVRELKQLSSLKVRGELSDSGAEEIGQLEQLEFLDLKFVKRKNDSDFEFEDIEPLLLRPIPSLKQLDISHSDFTINAEDVHAFSALTKVSLRNSLLSSRAIHKFKTLLEKVTVTGN